MRQRLRQPEHTGENRCLPCTAVNVALAAGLAGLVAVLSVPAAGGVFLAGLGVIWLRGYLVPGTPALTERYLPERVLRWVGKEPHPRADVEVFDRVEREREQSVDPPAFLQDVGALEPCADGTELCLTGGFAAAVEAELDGLTGARDGDGGLDLDPAAHRGTLADLFGVDPGEIEPRDRSYPALEVGVRVRKWPSEAALVSDLAVHRALAARTDRWAEVPVAQRREMLAELRGYHDACPVCGGPIRLGEEVVDSCCGRHRVRTVACGACDRRYREFDQARVGAEAATKGMTP